MATAIELRASIVRTYLARLPDSLRSDAESALESLTQEWDREADRRASALADLSRASRNAFDPHPGKVRT